MSGRHPIAFVVLVRLKSGSVLRYSAPLGVNATVVFCRDLYRWLLGSRPLGYRNLAGDDSRITAADVSSIDLMVSDSP